MNFSMNWSTPYFPIVTSYRVVQPEPASNEDLEEFHSSDYVHFLHENDDKEISNETKSEDFGLLFDCPSFPGYKSASFFVISRIYKHASWVAGASLCAAKQITQGRKIAVNW